MWPWIFMSYFFCECFSFSSSSSSSLADFVFFGVSHFLGVLQERLFSTFFSLYFLCAFLSCIWVTPSLFFTLTSSFFRWLNIPNRFLWADFVFPPTLCGCIKTLQLGPEINHTEPEKWAATNEIVRSTQCSFCCFFFWGGGKCT